MFSRSLARVERPASHESNQMTAWIDSINCERLFESNSELNSVEPKLLHQTNNKMVLLVSGFSRKSQNGAIWAKIALVRLV